MATEAPAREQSSAGVKVPNHEIRVLDAGDEGQQVEVKVMLPGVSDISDIEVSIEPPDTIHVDVPQRYHLQLRLAVPIASTADSVRFKPATGRLQLRCRVVEPAGEEAVTASGSSTSTSPAAGSSSGAVNSSRSEADEVDNSSKSGGAPAANNAGPAAAAAAPAGPSSRPVSQPTSSSSGRRKNKPPRRPASTAGTGQKAAGDVGGSQQQQQREDTAAAGGGDLQDDLQRRFKARLGGETSTLIDVATFLTLASFHHTVTNPPRTAHADNPVGWWCACWDRVSHLLVCWSWELLAWAFAIPLSRVPCGVLGRSLLYSVQACGIAAAILMPCLRRLWQQAWGLSLAAVILLPGFVAMEPSSDMFALRARIREHLQQSEALHAGLVKLVLACGSAAVLSRVLQPLLPSVLSIAAAAAVAGAGLLWGTLCWLWAVLQHAGTAPGIYWWAASLCAWSLLNKHPDFARVATGAYAVVDFLFCDPPDVGHTSRNVAAFLGLWCLQPWKLTPPHAPQHIQSNLVRRQIFNRTVLLQLLLALAPSLVYVVIHHPALWRLVLTPLSWAVSLASPVAARLSGIAGSVVTSGHSVLAAAQLVGVFGQLAWRALGEMASTTLPRNWLTAPLLLPAPLPQLSLIGWLAWPLQTLLSPLVLVCGGVFSTAQQLLVLLLQRAGSAARGAVWYGMACDVMFVKAAVRWVCDGGWLSVETCSYLASAASDSAVQQQASRVLVGLLSALSLVWCSGVAKRFVRLAQPLPRHNLHGAHSVHSVQLLHQPGT